MEEGEREKREKMKKGFTPFRCVSFFLLLFKKSTLSDWTKNGKESCKKRIEREREREGRRK